MWVSVGSTLEYVQEKHISFIKTWRYCTNSRRTYAYSCSIRYGFIPIFYRGSYYQSDSLYRVEQHRLWADIANHVEFLKYCSRSAPVYIFQFGNTYVIRVSERDRARDRDRRGAECERRLRLHAPRIAERALLFRDDDKIKNLPSRHTHTHIFSYKYMYYLPSWLDY